MMSEQKDRGKGNVIDRCSWVRLALHARKYSLRPLIMCSDFKSIEKHCFQCVSGPCFFIMIAVFLCISVQLRDDVQQHHGRRS